MGTIASVEEIARLCEAAQAAGNKIVVTYGSYALLHIGHIRHLRQARDLGGLLVVVLAPDGESGEYSLAVPSAMRAETLRHLDFIDYICVDAASLREALSAILPDIYAGMDDNGCSCCGENEQALCDELNIQFVKTGSVSFDSTLGINRSQANFSEEAREYLRLFRSRYDLDQVHNTLDAMGGLKIAVVGDAIIDEYCFCSPLGASSKDPILALRYQSKDIFAGGIVAVANHVANFASQVDMYTVLGDRDSHEEFIRENLKPNVRPVFARQKKAPTVRKLRYIEGYTQNKLIEIYDMEDVGLDPAADEAFRSVMWEALPQYDMVIAADFGHGAISAAARKLLTQRAPFLALNVQANSGNRGFHTVTKYDSANYISIAEHEVRLEMRDMRGPIRPMLDYLAPKLSCENFVVTRGKRGSLIRNANGQHIEVPAFARKVVDRIGAGDAFLSVTSMAAKLAAPPEVLCLIGNVVGALAVEILGNQKSIDKDSVKEYLESLLRG